MKNILVLISLVTLAFTAKAQTTTACGPGLTQVESKGGTFKLVFNNTNALPVGLLAFDAPDTTCIVGTVQTTSITGLTGAGAQTRTTTNYSLAKFRQFVATNGLTTNTYWCSYGCVIGVGLPAGSAATVTVVAP